MYVPMYVCMYVCVVCMYVCYVYIYACVGVRVIKYYTKEGATNQSVSVERTTEEEEEVMKMTI